MSPVAWQEVADVLEAVLLEKALKLWEALGDWQLVAEKISADAPATWPKTLGDGRDFNMSLDYEPLRFRLRRKLGGRVNRKRVVQRARAKAVAILSRSQVYAPLEHQSLWDWCIPKMHVIINIGKLNSLETSVSKSRRDKRCVHMYVVVLLLPPARGTHEVNSGQEQLYIELCAQEWVSLAGAL